MSSNKGPSPMDEAEQRLFPHLPYEKQTRAQRELVLKLCKDIVFERTGRRIP